MQIRINLQNKILNINFNLKVEKEKEKTTYKSDQKLLKIKVKP